MLKCKKINCTGCGVCSYSCPKNAIKMLENDEGFLYPKINKKLCIECDVCNLVCPVMIRKSENSNNKCFAVQLSDSKILKKCASGGAFWGIANTVIQKNGTVFGVEDCCGKLNYLKVNTINALEKLTGSKYYQCTLTADDYQEIKEASKIGLTLVSGTPCMVSAIKNMREINLENLITFEILCQGVPSKTVIQKFYHEKEKQSNKKIKKHYFRSKDKYIGRNYLNRYDYDNGEIEYLVGEDDPLSLSFQRQIFLRESCYRCKYSNEERVADFTAGDLWNYDLKIIDIRKGCSVLLCNSQKSLKLLYDSNDFIFEEIDSIKALENNIPYHFSVKRPYSRNYSYKLLKKISPLFTTKICCYKYYIKKIFLRGKQ